MKKTVYLETTIPSYLASQPSRDLVVPAHQQVTHDWWERARQDFELFVSESVLEEIRIGNPEMAKRRLELIQELPVLSFNEDIRELAETYTRHLGLNRAGADILHIAVAVSYRLDYLVTWNCKHIANGHVIQRLTPFNRVLQRSTPIIVTPEELLELPKGAMS